MTETTPVRVGIVGLGTIGRIHSRRIEELGGELVGADLDEAARESYAEDFDAETYPDHEALLDAGVDAVIVGVPNRFHEEIAVDALDAGVDVLIEKPLAHSVESAERIAAAARDADGFCTVGFTMRYYGITDRVVELREEGRFGDVTRVDVEYLRRDSVPGGGRGWFTDPDLAGGGVLMDLGVHIIDLALHLLDYPEITEVSGATRSDYGEYEVDDAAVAMLRCADGEVVTIDTSWRTAAESGRRGTIRGTEAGADFALGGSELSIVTPDGDEDVETETIDSENAHLAEDRAFLEAVGGEREEAWNTVEEALTVQRIIEAIYESSRRGEAVRLDDV